jgi:hypothetical protein
MYSEALSPCRLVHRILVMLEQVVSIPGLSAETDTFENPDDFFLRPMLLESKVPVFADMVVACLPSDGILPSSLRLTITSRGLRYTVNCRIWDVFVGNTPSLRCGLWC